MSTHNHSRQLTNGQWNLPNPLRSTSLQQDLEAALPGKKFGWKADGDTIEVTCDPDLDASEAAILAAALDAHAADSGLEEKKHARARLVDARTDELIAAGMSYGGQMFSLSLQSQMKMTASYVTRNDQEFTYPVVWNNIDDSNTVSLNDATDVRNFYLTALGTVRAHLDSGTALKDQIRAATTQAELDAVEDNR